MMLTQNQKVKVFREAALVRRMHCVPMHTDYTVGQHSHGALDLLLLLHPRPSLALIKAVQWHDKHERFVGDVPATAKRAHRPLGNALGHLEREINEFLGVQDTLDSLELDEKLWLQAVDLLDLMLTCEEEMQLGNSNAATTYNTVRGYLAEGMRLPEPVRRFLIRHQDMHREIELGPDGLPGPAAGPRDMEEELK